MNPMKFISILKCLLFCRSQAIAVVCVMLHYNTMELEFDSKMNIVVTGTFFGYAIICGVLLIGNNFDFRFFFVCSLFSLSFKMISTYRAIWI